MLETEGSRSGERGLGFHGVEDQLRRGYPRLFDGKMAALQTRHVQDVLDEVSHPGRGVLDGFDGLPRLIVWSASADLKDAGLHRDDAEWISQVVGDDSQHLIPHVDRLDRRVVETAFSIASAARSASASATRRSL